LPTGSQHQSAGFTLIELLVVLAIMALLLTALPALISAGSSTARVRNLAQQLSDDLRSARQTAVTSNDETDVILDLSRRHYMVGLNGLIRTLPADAILTFYGPQHPIRGDTALIQFFADGTSSGGQIDVSIGDIKRRITAHWLTGRIAVDE